MTVLPYTDLWFELLNAQLDSSRRDALNAHLARTLGAVCPPVNEAFFRRHAGVLQKLRDAWRLAKTQHFAVLLQPVVDACAPALRKNVVDALLAPGLLRSPAAAQERDPMLLKACVVGLAVYLQQVDVGVNVRRCEGLLVWRDEPATWSAEPSFPREADRVLSRRLLRADPGRPLQRCPVIFRPSGKGTLCSRRCRDRNVALRRSLLDPEYAARRQRRYRQRREARS